MKTKLLLLIIPLLFCASCNQQGWTEGQKNNFISECIKNAELEDGVAKAYCNCCLEIVIEKYPNAYMADTASSKLSEKELIDMFKPCLDKYVIE